MKKKEFNDLRSKDIQDIKKMVAEKRLEISKKSVEVMGGKEKNLKSANNLRHSLAQLLTLVREKEIIKSLQPKETVKEDTK